MGLPIAEVVSEENLSFSRDGEPYDYPEAPSIQIYYGIFQLKNENGEVELSNFSKALELGLAGVFKIGNIPVYISP
ncbi:MAG: hypothetical protein MUO85_06480 [candidate division Zixibacteria bacterium]|nr:hypothetical protein [candidate division Zixibacteria bacterium]